MPVAALAWLLLAAPDATPRLQALIDAAGGYPARIAPGDYRISKALLIRRNGSGLLGPARIVQTNPAEPIVRVERARDAVLRDLALARPEAAADTRREGIRADGCAGLVIERVAVRDNRSPAGSIVLRGCTECAVVGCRVENYATLAIDDRTQSPHYGYAFRCIDGTGVLLVDCTATRVADCRVVERRMLPTEELQRRHGLGAFVKRAEQRGSLVSEETWRRGSVDNWHQGSAITVTGPERSSEMLLSGNLVENAAQGIDIHADRVIVQGNVVDNAFIGMKAMHGSRNVIVQGNLFRRNDLWAIGLMPGAASRARRPGDAADPGNTDGGSVIANNVIADFGAGHAAWVWKDATRCPIRLDSGQEPDDPPLQGVTVTGNVIDVPAGETPRYVYAVLLVPAPRGPIACRFSANLFPAGASGVSNVPLPP